MQACFGKMYRFVLLELKKRNGFKTLSLTRRFSCPATEQWKIIPCASNYEASSLGNIRNCKTKRLRFINYDRFRAQKIAPQISVSGQSGNSKYFKIHLLVSRMVLSAFQPIDNLDHYQAIHLNGDQFDNKIENLQWMSAIAGRKHHVNIGTAGSANKPVIMTNNSGFERRFESTDQCHQYLLKNIKNGKGSKQLLSKHIHSGNVYKGHHFKFVNELYDKWNHQIQSMENEEWVVYHTGYLGHQCCVSNFGRSKIRNQGGYERLAKHSLFNTGYLRICAARKSRLLHRVVAECFVPNPCNHPFVDHIDTDNFNNKASNLRWVTAKQNANNPITRSKFYKKT